MHSLAIELKKNGHSVTGSDDVIYNPAETNFLKEGKELGNLIENGEKMFVYQASEAFKLWHGIEPEVNLKTLKLLQND